MPERPLELSRYCIPYTPFTAKLEEAKICLVTTAAVRGKDQPPFQVDGDNSFRTLDGYRKSISQWASAKRSESCGKTPSPPWREK